jgi:hypothetical protein
MGRKCAASARQGRTLRWVANNPVIRPHLAAKP